jgi:hypothetical protein
MRKAATTLANDNHHSNLVASLLLEEDSKPTSKVKSLLGSHTRTLAII